MVNYVMNFAPIGVLEQLLVFLPLGTFRNWRSHILSSSVLLIGISSLWVILILVGYIFLKSRMTVLETNCESFNYCFGTTSSEAVFPN
jgi:Na+/H+-dicarboxylate symporter